MKKKLALFLAICTLSGCANTMPKNTTATAQISDTSSVTTETTTTPPITTTAQTTTAVTEKAPQKYEGDMPELTAENLDFPWDIIVRQPTGKYHINTKYRTDKLVSMTVTVYESGTQRNYIFEEIAQNFLGEGCVHANLRGEAYGMLCFTINTYTGSYLFMLDPERNTVQYFNADSLDGFLSAKADTLLCYADMGYYAVVPEINP